MVENNNISADDKRNVETPNTKKDIRWTILIWF